ncbi:PQQ-binding-like beta-propeller repeat protein [Promicromonospora sp. MEB111]|uniref:outer membrane protein assembly factor BamB family protein n=1 Tax=Promicromonospora sp. MEB111 TaxID=3040301 RepID=UPI00254BF351|nr:PQQ-binding-like beta-propeller repeat protein [Promicromonospora sp. MEB111]
MTERTQPDSAAPGSSDPEKVHTFDLIDEVPGASGRTAGPDDVRPDGADPGDGSGTAADGDGASAPREPGRVTVALAGARTAVGRTARRGGAAVRRRLPSTRRGKVLLAGGTAVVVVLAVVAGVLVDAQVRHRDLLAAPGGVRSLAEKPTEQWSVDLENPISATLVEMPGLLAIVGDEQVRGVDPATGEVRWTVHVGQYPDCGPTGRLGVGGPVSAEPADPLVCVSSGEAPQEVTVIRPDGTTASRELDEGAVVAPAADGTLITFELTGEEQEPRPVVVDKMGAAHLPKGFTGPDLVVRREDAATGAERWSETVAFGAPLPESCVTYDDNAPNLDVAGALGWTLLDGVLEVQGCGVSAAFLLDGTRLDDPEDPADAPAGGLDTASFAALPDGGWVQPAAEPAADGAARDAVHLPGGGAVTLDGRALVPWATDGRDPGLLLARVGSRTSAVSTDGKDAGEVLWTVPDLAVVAVLARVSGTAVVMDEEGEVHGIDLGTGAERWTVDPDVLSTHGMAWTVESMIFGAYTDGDTVLFPASADPAGDSSGLRLLAIDVRDGSVRWEVDQDTPYTQVISVDGYVAQITQQGVVGLG